MEQGDTRPLAPHPSLMLPGIGAVVLAAVFLLCGLYFGSTRNFGAFLLSVPFLGLTFLGAAIVSTWTTRIRAQRQHAILAATLIIATIPAYLCSYDVAQRLRFLLWAQSHRDLLASMSHRDGIVEWWDGWGFAGEDTDSYLVADLEDRLGSKSHAEQWTKRVGQTCGISHAQRMEPRFYIVTTYTNCPYDKLPALTKP